MLLVICKRRGQLDLSAIPDTGHARRRNHRPVDHPRLARPGADCVGIIKVVLGLYEVKDILMHVPESVRRVVRPTLHFVPDDTISENPTLLIGHGEGHPPGNTEQALAMVAVADVQPERAGRLENAPYFEDCREQVLDVLRRCPLKSNAAS